MKSSRPIVISLVALLLIACATIYKLMHGHPSSLKEQVSYTIGSQFGKSLTSQNLDLDPSMVSRGLVDAIKKNTSALSEAEMESAMVQLNEQRRKEQQSEAIKNKGEADAFLEKNRAEEGVKVLKSGVQYKILAEGKGASPKPDDIVVINYHARLIDGKEFDSTDKRGVPAEFPLKGVIPGWAEGLLQMKRGGHAMIFVPPEQAYGDRPRQNIPANAVLIFDVNLVDFHSAPTAPKK